LELLVNFWERLVGDLAVEFNAAAQGKAEEFETGHIDGD